MQANHLSLSLESAKATARCAQELGRRLKPGDVVLLRGAVGAGKTHFARALIQSVLSEPEDVPSPTFTLVQTYDTLIGTVWHADLYRLTSISEIEELGLTDAFDAEICLIEWPDRLGDLSPPHALDITLSAGESDEERHLAAFWTDPRWDIKLKDWTA